MALAGALFLAAVAPAIADAEPGVERLSLANGISATVYTASYFATRLSELDGQPALRLDDGRYLPVITDIADPAIYNKGDGTFHPFGLELVASALSALDHPTLHLTVRVYLLPYPRRGVLVSSTSGFELFLSPHVLAIDPAVGAYIVTHELGHAFHNRFLPDDSGKWTEYRRLRGITDESRFQETSSHAYRPKEIFAEDFRALFGGVDARMDGRIENPELVSPEAVAGLESFFVHAAETPPSRGPRIVATSLPNPFNPSTEIRVSVPAELVEEGGRVSVRVYSVTGALVRELYRGSAGGDLTVRWDGTDGAGNRVASATYYAAIQVGDASDTVKLVLLK